MDDIIVSNKIKYEEICHNFINSIPVDVIGLAEELGIEVYDTDLENDISGYISKDENGIYICVNKSHPATRQQFTIAHEIGHFVLHQECLEAGNLAPTFYKSGNGIIMPRAEINIQSPTYNKMETEANKFAANLLMPEQEFIKKANESDDLVELARYFKVSVGAASIRANALGIEIY